MKSPTVLGIAFLVMAAGLGAFELLLPKMANLQPSVGTPTPFATTLADVLPQTGSDWETLQPHHEPLPKRHHHLMIRHKHVAEHHTVVHHKSTVALDAPLPAPTFLPSTPESKAAPVQIVAPPPTVPVEVLSAVHKKVVVRHTPRPTPEPTIYAPPTFSPADLARQRQLERSALVNAAVRSARGTVASSVPNAQIVSADADDHGRYVSVVVVEQRTTGTVVENFIFVPSANGLGLSERRVISQNYADPFISH